MSRLPRCRPEPPSRRSVGMCHRDCDAAPAIRVYDRLAFVAALDEDDDTFVGPEEERPLSSMRSRSTEDETWARLLRKIVADPTDGWRRLLVGDAAMAERLVAATATMPHFSTVTGIIERAVLTSASAGGPVRFPPVLMLSEPGLGKTHYAAPSQARSGRASSRSRSTPHPTAACSGAPPRRGAARGWVASPRRHAVSSARPRRRSTSSTRSTSAPASPARTRASILLSALEPENARAFVDEYLDVPIRLDHALWLASANATATIPPPLLSRDARRGGPDAVPRPGEGHRAVRSRPRPCGLPIADDARRPAYRAHRAQGPSGDRGRPSIRGLRGARRRVRRSTSEGAWPSFEWLRARRAIGFNARLAP